MFAEFRIIFTTLMFKLVHQTDRLSRKLYDSIIQGWARSSKVFAIYRRKPPNSTCRWTKTSSVVCDISITLSHSKLNWNFVWIIWYSDSNAILLYTSRLHTFWWCFILFPRNQYLSSISTFISFYSHKCLHFLTL